MVRKLLIAACGVLATQAQTVTEEAETLTKEEKVSPNLMSTLKSADSYARINSKPHKDGTPIVGMKSYLFDDKEDIKKDFLTLGDYGSIGYEVDYHADLYASFDMPTYWMYRQDTNWMIYNPNLFIEAAA